MKANRHLGNPRNTILALVVALVATAGVSQAADTYRFANGINATVHGAAEIAAALQPNKDGQPVLVHPVVGTLPLEPAERKWYPFDERIVVAALEALGGFETDLDVEVFVLPAPPAEVGSSFARRGAIYLSPGFGEVAASTVAYITAHEMGHVMTWAFLDGRVERWNEYLDLRGLDESNTSPDAAHADRAREILAEDIRYLFGGPLATSSGSIENHDLVTPDRVEGLEELLAGYFEADVAAPGFASAQAYPNPCNPLTTIEMALESESGVYAGDAVLRVYDIRGALVRTVQGGHVANGRVSIQWNGADDFGGAAATGRYFYTLQAGDNLGRGSVTLIR